LNPTDRGDISRNPLFSEITSMRKWFLARVGYLVLPDEEKALV
jgi:hypothetical protein